MNCKALALAAALFAAASGAHAAEVYSTIGTEGFGLGFGYGPSRFVGARIDVNGIAVSHNFNAGDIHYDGRARLVHGGLYLDLFPAPTLLPFHLTAGVIVGRDRVDAIASSVDGYYTFKGVAYPTNGQTVTGHIKMPTVRPYVGIGLGHAPKGAPGWSASFDAGVAIGRPTLDLDVPATVVAEAGQANVDYERAQLQDKINKIHLYPIVKLGVTYRW